MRDSSPAYFRSAVGDSDYRAAGWEATRARVVANPSASRASDLNDKRRKTFTELANRWTTDTNFTSSVTDMISHPAYRSIIDMGLPVVGLLLERLEKQPGFWFQALFEITGENPVHEEDAGDFDLMAQAWLDWGSQNGYR